MLPYIEKLDLSSIKSTSDFVMDTNKTMWDTKTTKIE